MLFIMGHFLPGMIFVILAYENVRGHTAGFVGLQLSLILVAWQNTLKIWDSNIGYSYFDFLGGGEAKRVRNTKRGALVYIITQSIVSFAKLYFWVSPMRPSVG